MTSSMARNIVYVSGVGTLGSMIAFYADVWWPGEVGKWCWGMCIHLCLSMNQIRGLLTHSDVIAWIWQMIWTHLTFTSTMPHKTEHSESHQSAFQIPNEHILNHKAEECRQSVVGGDLSLALDRSAECLHCFVAQHHLFAAATRGCKFSGIAQV